MEHKELIELRSYGLRAQGGWKRRSRDSDLLVQGKFSTLWPDATMDDSDPLVEHVYNEALNDKAASVAAVSPYVEVSPVRGTSKDEAERAAQRRRRAFISFLRDSQVEDKSTAWAFDWLQHGAKYAMPCKDWRTKDPHPYIVRFDPRAAFPLSHDMNDKLRSIFFLANRTVLDLEADWGVDYATRVGHDYLKVADPATQLASQYRILGIPSHYFIDRDGVLQTMKIGSLDIPSVEAAVEGIKR